MGLIWIDDLTPLPPSRLALGHDSDAPGLLAAGGSVTVARLREAYGQGVFPWFSPGQPPLWWTPDPRMVLPVAEFRLSASLKKTLRRFARTPGCEIRIDHDFRTVMQACANAPREGQAGTWIVPEMVDAYCAWHAASDAASARGRPHSVETWIDDELAGGLYLVNLGTMVFGESMFAWRTDASKIALAALVAFCRGHGITLIDCQQHTRHLASFGARELRRTQFEAHLARAVPAAAPARWFYDRALWAWLDAGIEVPVLAASAPPPAPRA